MNRISRNVNFSSQGKKVHFCLFFVFSVLCNIRVIDAFLFQVYYPYSEVAVKDIGDNSTILFGGFGVLESVVRSKQQSSNCTSVLE